MGMKLARFVVAALLPLTLVTIVLTSTASAVTYGDPVKVPRDQYQDCLANALYDSDRLTCTELYFKPDPSDVTDYSQLINLFVILPLCCIALFGFIFWILKQRDRNFLKSLNPSERDAVLRARNSTNPQTALLVAESFRKLSADWENSTALRKSVTAAREQKAHNEELIRQQLETNRQLNALNNEIRRIQD